MKKNKKKTPSKAANSKSQKKSNAKYFVHPRAFVEDGAKIGDGTRIWAFTHVMPGAVIGKECNLCDYSFVESGATLGNHVTVKNGIQIWEGVTIEDDVFLGPNCVFTNDMFPRSFIKPPKEKWLKKTLLKKGCSIGANVTIVCGSTIGEYAFVGAGSVVTSHVPDYAMVVGNPAHLLRWVCKCTQALSFDETGKTKCAGCSQGYSLKNNRVYPL